MRRHVRRSRDNGRICDVRTSKFEWIFRYDLVDSSDRSGFVCVRSRMLVVYQGIPKQGVRGK